MRQNQINEGTRFLPKNRSQGKTPSKTAEPTLDKRRDCKQAGHHPNAGRGLVVSRCGMRLGYEVFAGNRPDVTTTEQIVKNIVTGRRIGFG